MLESLGTDLCRTILIY
jgi:hypothetical protein